MQTLLAAVGQTWAAHGHPDLAAAIADITVPDEIRTGSGVPPHMVADYAVALNGMDGSHGLRGALERLGATLAWSEGSRRMPESFRGRYAYVELAGPMGMVAHDMVSFGVYLQKAATVYPSHWHEAVEHYLVLSGVADWQMDDAPFVARIPGQSFMHQSNQPHATTTHDTPLLALWFWQGNIADSTYRIAGVDV